MYSQYINLSITDTPEYDHELLQLCLLDNLSLHSCTLSMQFYQYLSKNLTIYLTKNDFSFIPVHNLVNE